MMKKILIAISLIAVLLAFLFGSDAMNVIGTSIGMVRSSVRGKVPLEFDLKRARQMVDDLTPHIRENLRLIAREEVEIERLEQQINDLSDRQAKGRLALQTLQRDLQSGKSEIEIGQTIHTSTQARELAETRFRRFRTDDDRLSIYKNTLAVRQQVLDSAQQKLDEMIASKQQLMAKIEALEARQAMNEIAKTSSHLQLDESQMARTRELIDEIDKRIQVEERIVESEVNYLDEMILSEPDAPTADVVDEIAAYFADPDDAQFPSNQIEEIQVSTEVLQADDQIADQL